MGEAGGTRREGLEVLDALADHFESPAAAGVDAGMLVRAAGEVLARREGAGKQARRPSVFWLVFVAACVLWAWGMVPASSLIAVIPGLLVGAIFRIEAEREYRRRVREQRRIQGSACLRCGFMLTGIDRPIPKTLVGRDVGPRRCPECGLPWPMVLEVNGARVRVREPEQAT